MDAEGFNGLYTLVKETLHQEPTSGLLFVRQELLPFEAAPISTS